MEIIKDLIYDTTTTPYSQHMKKCVQDLDKRVVWKEMVKKLKFDKTNFRQTFSVVGDEMFADGKYNWGRIVALAAFSKKVAEQLDGDNEFSQFAGKYFDSKTRDWVNGRGWDVFLNFSPSPIEDNFWKRIFQVALGLGSLAFVLYFR